jgi:hypothetical protein
MVFRRLDRHKSYALSDNRAFSPAVFKLQCWTVDERTGDTPMPVQVLCPNLRCRKLLSVPDEVRGKLVKCQHCQMMLRVPDGMKKPQGVGAGKTKS